MKNKLEQIRDVLMKAQDYTDKEMQAICDIDAMDEAKELFVELDKAVTIINSLIKDSETSEKPATFIPTFVGYQVKTRDGKFVAPYTDKDVFRSIEDAQDVIRSQRNSIDIDPEEKESLGIVFRWLESEDEKKSDFTVHGSKKRVFEKNEKVWDDGNSQWVLVRMKSFVCHEDDPVPVQIDNKGYAAKADDLYQLADGKYCPCCGNPLCIEHQTQYGYPYYCPECLENFYTVEVK